MDPWGKDSWHFKKLWPSGRCFGTCAYLERQTESPCSFSLGGTWSRVARSWDHGPSYDQYHFPSFYPAEEVWAVEKSPLVGAGGLGSLSLPLQVTMLAFREYRWTLRVLVVSWAGREQPSRSPRGGTRCYCSCDKGQPHRLGALVLAGARLARLCSGMTVPLSSWIFCGPVTRVQSRLVGRPEPSSWSQGSEGHEWHSAHHSRDRNDTYLWDSVRFPYPQHSVSHYGLD